MHDWNSTEAPSSPADKRLHPGVLILLDDEPLAGRAIQRLVQSLGGQYEVLLVRSLLELQQTLIPRRRRIAGRIRVRGFFLDWFLDPSRRVLGLDALEWLDATYPRTPVFMFTGSEDVDAIAGACERRGFGFVSSEEVPGRREPGSDLMREALLGLVLVKSTPMPVVRRLSLRTAFLRYCEERHFGPWDARCIGIRRWLLEAAGANAIEVNEHHLRTLDAYFDSVPVVDLSSARGVQPTTMQQIVSNIREIWDVSDLDVLRYRWEREQGRGAILTRDSQRNELGPSAAAPARPSARRNR